MSTVKIYKTHITPDRNALVDDLADYLNTLTPVFVSDDCQYQKIELDMYLKINADQKYVGETVGNYLDLYQDNKHFYFFILGATWKSENTVELKLSIDSINTFRNDFTFNKKTTISRQHKDRLTENIRIGNASKTIVQEDNVTEYTTTFELTGHSPSVAGVIYLPSDGTVISHDETLEGNTLTVHVVLDEGNVSENIKISVSYTYTILRRLIDFMSEGATPLLFHKQSEDTQIEADGLDWYLIYKNKEDIDPGDYNQVNPVNCFLCASESFMVQPNESSYSGTWYKDRFNDNALGGANYAMHLISSENDDTTIQMLNVNEAVMHSVTLEAGTNKMVRLYKDGFFVLAYIYTYDSSWNITNTEQWTGGTFIKFIDAKIARDGVETDSKATAESYSPDPTINQPTSARLISIDELDRADSKVIKVIKLPYCPTPVTIAEGVLSYDNDKWSYNVSESLLELVDLNLRFDNEIVTTEANPYEELVITEYAINTNSLRNDYYESKLYHSDFYQPKFIYDSFDFIFKLEQMNITAYYANFKVDYNVTSTINSRFMFTFPQYSLRFSTEDYDNILIVNRNNEETLYNSAYINYIKTGYNYDVKNKQRQEAASWITTGLQIGGAILGAAAGAATGNPIAVATAIGMGVSGLTSITQNINNSISAEASIQQKLAQAKAQATAVAGADDVDLMSVYTGNKAKIATYKVSPTVNQQFADLFYYTGYIENKQAVPNMSTRYWFNYMMCTPVFNEETNTPYSKFLADIKTRYQSGVTVYHHHSDWDWSQTHENWEVSIIS